MSNGSMNGVIDTHQYANQDRQMCRSSVLNYRFECNSGVVMALLSLQPLSSFFKITVMDA